MNERVRELSAEAWRYANNNSDEVMPQLRRFEQQFAKLLIKECAAVTELPEYVGRRDLNWYLVFREYFGVK